MVTNGLRKAYPWLSTSPVIVNAPMAGFAGPELAIAVHKAGGFGFIGATLDLATLRTALESACQSLLNESAPAKDEVLPIGLGILIFHQTAEAEEYLRLIGEFKPAAVWLFGADSGYESWSRGIREVSPESKVWVQLSSVAAALEAVRTCKPNVLVLQGSDAGGHGNTPGASVLSLIPEVADALAEAGCGDVSLVAAGGIADGRGVAAALAAGYDGVVMGTAFLAAEETLLHEAYRDAVLEASDGGVSTIRSTIFDELPGKNIWPGGYDGRAIVARSYEDHVDGTSVDELRRLHKEAKTDETQGFGPGNRRAAIWAGTGVGLVKKVRPAKAILEEVRVDAKRALQRAVSLL